MTSLSVFAPASTTKVRVYLQGRDLRLETGDQWGVSDNSTNNIGCTYIDMGKFDLALDCFQQVLATSRAGGSRCLETLAFSNPARPTPGSAGPAKPSPPHSRQSRPPARSATRMPSAWP